MLRLLFIKLVSKLLVWPAFLLVLFLSCREKESSSGSWAESSVVSTDIPHDSLHHLPDYFLYNSIALKDSGNAVLLLILDPNAAPEIPMRMYRSLADSVPMLMLGSRRSKNGISPEEAEGYLRNILADVYAKFPRHRFQLYLAGFSGGGSLAITLSEKIPDCRGLIVAASPGNSIPAVPMIGFAGLGDPNFSDMQARMEATEARNVPVCLRLWPGKHAWPDAANMAFAFAWMKAHLPLSNAALPLYERSLAEKSKLSLPPDVERKWQELDFLERSLSLKAQAGNSLKGYRNSDAFRKAKRDVQRQLMQEMNQKAIYRQAFFEKDLRWWEAECSRLVKVKPIPWENQRMMGFLSLLAYSASHSALNQQNDDAAARFIRIYRLADPENPEAPYLEAVLEARKGNPEAAKRAMNDAISIGFTDIDRIRNQPEFRKPGFEALLNQP